MTDMITGERSSVLGHGLPETADREGAFPRLNELQLERLRPLGETLHVMPGDVLFSEGEQDFNFYVIESGMALIVQGLGEENRVVGVHGASRFLGELNILSGRRAFLAAIVRDEGDVIKISPTTLRALVNSDEELSNLFLRAFLARRSLLVSIGAGVKVVGSRFSPDVRRVREFLARNRQPYQWLDVEVDDDAAALVEHMGLTPCELPVVVGAGGVARRPSNAQLGALLGLGARGEPPAMCDVVVVGGGPAGLAAALYGASEGLDTQAIDAVAFGGQASTSARIENYLGFPTGISGSELAERASLQAKRLGARLTVPSTAVELRREEGHFAIGTEDGQTIRGRTLIVATGAHYRRLPLPDLERFEGVGVYYAATLAESQLCADQHVMVVGGGNSAGQASLYLSRHAISTRLVIRGDDLGKSMSTYLIDEIEQTDGIEVVYHSEVSGLRGERSLEELTVTNRQTAATQTLPVTALFVFIGADPYTDWLRGQVAMDEHGFLLTGRDLLDADLELYGDERPHFLETSQPGLFAVGDVHSGSIKRVASAVGEGSMAIKLVHQRLAAPVALAAV